MKRILAAAALLAALPAHAADAISVTPVIATDRTATGQRIEVPRMPEVIVTTVVIPPHATLPVHKHLYPRYGYVLEGTLAVTQTDTGKTFIYRPGDFIAEMRDQWHSAANNTDAPVKLLVIDQVPAGTRTNTIVKQ